MQEERTREQLDDFPQLLEQDEAPPEALRLERGHRGPLGAPAAGPGVQAEVLDFALEPEPVLAGEVGRDCGEEGGRGVLRVAREVLGGRQARPEGAGEGFEDLAEGVGGARGGERRAPR